MTRLDEATFEQLVDLYNKVYQSSYSYEEWRELLDDLDDDGIKHEIIEDMKHYFKKRGHNFNTIEEIENYLRIP
ncbi:hypothetical protein TRFO_39626 [Tritrichomonas foetus]|uniref:Uncharacterized protein n=1 Tax=Tritrichomonas foetus TaxID=1144522 RepID=A0A1J4J9P6_9EUKA|nr:hypothetical protein TRFO_39626 [Tritrichomonas foetus]|eukprot:OHS94157.1 hypothetical protein TRFO_39626 [Tritrichomonas foetus]